MIGSLQAWLRFLAAAALLIAAAVFLQARSRPELLPPRKALDLFPKKVGDWSGMDSQLPRGVLEGLGPGEFLTRIYQRPPREPYIDFFLAYFPTQRTGSTIHSPQNCIPGAGWTPIESSRLNLPQRSRKAITVNRYLIAKGMDHLLVLYWYQAHGRAVASEYWAKFYLVADAIRMNRTDGSLVRVVTPLGPGETSNGAQKRAVEFALDVLPLLDRYVPQ